MVGADKDKAKEKAPKPHRRPVEKPAPQVYRTQSKEEEEFGLWARVPPLRRDSAREAAQDALARLVEKAVVSEVRPVFDWKKETIRKKKIKEEKWRNPFEDEEDWSSSSSSEEELRVVDLDAVETDALMVDTSPYERETRKPLGMRYVIPFPDTSLIDATMFKELDRMKDEDELSEVSGHSSVSDPGNEAAFNALGGKPTDFRDDGGERHYRYMCKQLDVVPSQHFIRQLRTSNASFRYYGLDPRGVRPMTEALSRNKYVKRLDLEENWLTYDSACHLTELFLENDTIEYLNLTGCRLGPESAWKIGELMTSTRRLRKLLLASNAIGERGAAGVAVGIAENMSIEKLDLSRNGLGRRAAVALGAVIEDNWTLRTLDLSWNALFDKDSFRKLADGLVKNQILEKLILAGNALSMEVIRPLRLLIVKNKTLRKLDLSFNRINDRCLAQLRRPLSRNKNLRMLKIGNNPITYTAAGTFLAAIQKFPDNGINLLDMEAIWVDSKFKQTEREIQRERSFRTITAGLVSDYQVKGPDQMGLLMKRAYFEGMSPKKKKQKRDFGHFLLKPPKRPLPLKRFLTRIKDEKLKIADTLTEELGRRFFNEKAKVDMTRMRDKYLEYFPDTQLPQPKEKKRKSKGKKGRKSKKKSGAAPPEGGQPPAEGAPPPENCRMCLRQWENSKYILRLEALRRHSAGPSTALERSTEAGRTTRKINSYEDLTYYHFGIAVLFLLHQLRPARCRSASPSPATSTKNTTATRPAHGPHCGFPEAQISKCNQTRGPF